MSINVSSIELIKVNGRGKNALDFFIAFYLGKYFDNIKEAKIIIFSKDTDYDQLIKHLDGYGISIERKEFVKNVNKHINGKNESKQKLVKSKKETDDVKTILKYLQDQTKSQKNKRPKKIKTLENYLHTHFSKSISINKIKEAIGIMIENKKIIITNNKIDYKTI